METKDWKEKLLYQPKNGWERTDAAQEAAMEDYCRGYKAFLDAGKTERLCVREAVRLAQASGFRPYTRGMALKSGDKVYLNTEAYIAENKADNFQAVLWRELALGRQQVLFWSWFGMEPPGKRMPKFALLNPGVQQPHPPIPLRARPSRGCASLFSL